MIKNIIQTIFSNLHFAANGVEISFLFFVLIIVSLLLFAVYTRNLVYSVLNLGLLSLVLILMWMFFLEVNFILLVYILAFVGAIIMLFLSVVLMLPTSTFNYALAVGLLVGKWRYRRPKRFWGYPYWVHPYKDNQYALHYDLRWRIYYTDFWVTVKNTQMLYMQCMFWWVLIIIIIQHILISTTDLTDRENTMFQFLWYIVVLAPTIIYYIFFTVRTGYIFRDFGDGWDWTVLEFFSSPGIWAKIKFVFYKLPLVWMHWLAFGYFRFFVMLPLIFVFLIYTIFTWLIIWIPCIGLWTFFYGRVYFRFERQFYFKIYKLRKKYIYEPLVRFLTKIRFIALVDWVYENDDTEWQFPRRFITFMESPIEVVKKARTKAQRDWEYYEEDNVDFSSRVWATVLTGSSFFDNTYLIAGNCLFWLGLGALFICLVFGLSWIRYSHHEPYVVLTRTYFEMYFYDAFMLNIVLMYVFKLEHTYSHVLLFLILYFYFFILLTDKRHNVWWVYLFPSKIWSLVLYPHISKEFLPKDSIDSIYDAELPRHDDVELIMEEVKFTNKYRQHLAEVFWYLCRKYYGFYSGLVLEAGLCDKIIKIYFYSKFAAIGLGMSRWAKTALFFGFNIKVQLAMPLIIGFFSQQWIKIFLFLTGISSAGAVFFNGVLPAAMSTVVYTTGLVSTKLVLYVTSPLFLVMPAISLLIALISVAAVFNKVEFNQTKKK